MMKVMDVSKWHGMEIDWEKVKESGVEGVMLRAGYGKLASQKDPTFERNYAECKRVGLPVGVYWYSYAASVQEASQEAAVLLQVIAGKQFELPIAYDMEYEPCILALTNAQRTQLVKTFLGQVEQAGYYGMLYASTDFVKNKLDYKNLSRFDVWAAQYGPKCTCPMPYGIWQYTSTGKVDGVRGNVDLNECYKDYPAIMKAAGLNGFAKSPGQPAGDGSGAAQTRPPEQQEQPSTPAALSTITIGPVSPGDFAVLHKLVADKAAQLGNIPVKVA